jgi:orotate phosphoribosyltransferase
MDSPASRQDVLARRIHDRSRMTGEFRLRSGVVSDRYFDKYLFEAEPELLLEVGEALAALLPPRVDAVAGLVLGGVPLATIVSQVTGLPTLFVRQEAKGHGTRRLAEGGEVAGRRLAVVEDVLTSGGQVLESCGALRELGADIVAVLCVVDRESGGAENLARHELELRALFTMTELRRAAGVLRRGPVPGGAESAGRS